MDILGRPQERRPLQYDVNTSFAGLRGSFPPTEISEFKVKSQARLYVEIRRTF